MPLGRRSAGGVVLAGRRFLVLGGDRDAEVEIAEGITNIWIHRLGAGRYAAVARDGAVVRFEQPHRGAEVDALSGARLARERWRAEGRYGDNCNQHVSNNRFHDTLPTCPRLWYSHRSKG